MNNQRLFDIVRYLRGEALNEGLITEDEYAMLVSAPSKESVGRLESYDVHIKDTKEKDEKIKYLNNQIGQLLKEKKESEEKNDSLYDEAESLKEDLADVLEKLDEMNETTVSIEYYIDALRILRDLLKERNFETIGKAKRILETDGVQLGVINLHAD